jgi:hypothetical protein
MLNNLIGNNIGILTISGVPVNGTSGSYAGRAGIGSELVDILTGIHYINIGTRLSPVWYNPSAPVANGIAGGLLGGGLGSIGNAKMTYSFAVDGGAIATITPTNSPTLPAGAIILGGVIDITTTFTSGGSATIALGFGSGAQVASLKSATAVASYAAGTSLVIIPIFTSATYYKLTAAARMSLTVAVAALTAGVMDVNLAYVQGNV